MFLAEATFWPVLNADLRRTREQEADREVSANRLNGLPAPDLYVHAGVDDAHPDTMESIVALALPVDAYRRFANDSVALLKTKVWEGASIGVSFQNASPEDLVRQLLGQPQHSDDGPPPLLDVERDLARMRSQALHDHPEWSRLNGRAVCSRPQPARAPLMVAEGQVTGDSTRLTQTKRDAEARARPATFRSHVMAVTVPAVVTTAEGAFVGGLAGSDFRLFEDGVEQRIDRVMSDAEPFTAVLLVDVSGSMWPKRTDAKVAASAFIDQLRPEDRALVATFDSRTWLMADVTNDKPTLRSAIVRLPHAGILSKLYDALDVVTAERLEQIGGRKALVVLTDGMDNASQVATARTAMARLESAGVPVYSVQFDTTATAPHPQPAMGQIRVMPEGYFDSVTSFRHAGEYLRQLARDTGGLFSAATNVETVVAAFRCAADDLRSQYVLRYYPSNQSQDSAFRSIRVVVNRPDLTVRARLGYVAGTSPRSPEEEQ